MRLKFKLRTLKQLSGNEECIKLEFKIVQKNFMDFLKSLGCFNRNLITIERR